MNDAVNALLTYIEELQKALLAQLEAIRAIRTLLIAQQEKPSLLGASSALKELNRILVELPHTASTPEIRDLIHSAKQALMEGLVQRIQLHADAIATLEQQPVNLPLNAKTSQAP
jgi:aspartate aminotransferase-like enzyme